MRESSKAALGGMVVALSVVIMLMTYLSPLLVYTAPPFAGILIILILNEIGYSWALGTYVSISLLSLFVIADKEAAVLFTFFFGYYPILRAFLGTKIKRRPLKALIKIAVYNISLAGAVLVSMYVFAIDYSDFSEGGRAFVALSWALMNIVLLVYDILLNRLQLLYELKLKVKFRKLFRR